MSTHYSKWVLARTLFPVTGGNFSDAIDIVRQQIKKETGQTPSLKITFYKAAREMQEIPELNIPILLGEVHNPEFIPRALWRNANLVQATFNTSGNDSTPALKATIRTKGPHTSREMVFNVDPPAIGHKIGDHVLHHEPRFTFWSRGIR